MPDKFENKKDIPKQSIADDWLELLPRPDAALMIKKQILKNLFAMARQYQYGNLGGPDFTNSNPKDSTENFKNTFASYGMILDRMEVIYPEDRDVAIIKKLLQDLEEDLYNSTEGQNLKFDKSIAEILVNEESYKPKKIELNGKEKIPLDYFKLLEEIISLKSIGIEPDYAVLSENPNAPTLVLFLEEHAENLTKEAKISNDYMEKAFTKAINNNIISDIYVEGKSDGKFVSYQGKEAEAAKLNRDQISAVARVSMQFGNKINLIGIEYDDLKGGNVRDELVRLEEIANNSGIQGPDKYKTKENIITNRKIFFQRAVFENLFMAMNIRDIINYRKTKISFGVIGVNHEISKKQIPTDKGIPHPLPFSNTLANNGINVIVVDATTK